jgi:hypothetical protein
LIRKSKETHDPPLCSRDPYHAASVSELQNDYNIKGLTFSVLPTPFRSFIPSATLLT